MLDKAIVITSINNPTKAVREFSKLSDYKTIVVGDKKTPLNWHCEAVDFIGISEQETTYKEFTRNLYYNSYARKMVGYVYAIKNGATIIVDTDDDNIPYDYWDFPHFQGEFEQLAENEGFVNIYSLYTKHKIWPRGLPLQYIKNPKVINKTSNEYCNIGIWQGLADIEPDVDAIYRLVVEHPKDFTFDGKRNIVLNSGTYSPFNSQNTCFHKSCFHLLYLPVTVSFRFTDIFRSLVALPIMANHNLQLGFTKATVYQLRNEHCLMDDFRSEVDVYLHSGKIIDIVGSSLKSSSMADNMIEAYVALEKYGIVNSKDVTTLQSWISTITPSL